MDPIALRPFSAAAGAAVARAPEMGASLFRGLTETRFPKRRPGFVSRRKRASLRPKGALISAAPRFSVVGSSTIFIIISVNFALSAVGTLGFVMFIRNVSSLLQFQFS